jgi:acetolactate synthase-1/2/3 large subunit
MKGATVVAETLKAYGTKHFFLLTGGDNQLWIALRDAGIDMVLSRSERSAAAMADAYARLTNRPTFAYGQAGPGAAVLVGGLVDPYWAGTPVIALTSSSSLEGRYRGAYQEINQWPLFEPMCKMNVEVPNAGRIADLLRTAYRVSVSGNPGPVHLDVPRSALDGEAGDVEIYAEADFTAMPPFRPAPDADAVQRAVALVAQAARPVILAGGGVMLSDAWDELIALAEQLRVPVATTMGGKGAIAETHELALGVAGRYSRRSANELMGQADVVLAIGCGLGALATNDRSLFGLDVQIVHIDLDPEVLGRSHRETISMQADAGAAIAALRAAAGAQPGRPQGDDWLETAAARTTEWRDAVNTAAAAGADGALAPTSIVRQLSDVMAPDDVMVVDTGYMAAWAGALHEVKAAGRNFMRTGGSLGWALPAVMGAQIARPESRSVAIIGDGGIGYHVGDMETAVRRELPVVVVVLNNRMLAYEYHIQKHQYDTEVGSVNDFDDTNYAAVARAYGWHGERIEAAADVPRALADAFAQRRPALIEFMVDKEAIAPVTSFERLIPRDV